MAWYLFLWNVKRWKSLGWYLHLTLLPWLTNPKKSRILSKPSTFNIINYVTFALTVPLRWSIRALFVSLAFSNVLSSSSLTDNNVLWSSIVFNKWPIYGNKSIYPRKKLQKNKNKILYHCFSLATPLPFYKPGNP